MEELDQGRYSVKPSSAELSVEIVNGSFAWDSLNTTTTTTGSGDRTNSIDYIDRRLKAAGACRRPHRHRRPVLRMNLQQEAQLSLG